ncbi:hypothetical protein BT96DRAFT_234501 [Gymnopus androsaceus JB14]|uniref:BBC1/AIM3 cysteine proteinase-fold domain-containing protein n=1 Tax=Gymnopus androsaceus JB14 TaxID=1447944 RepID=A0A6A4IJM3_9AGAR|nr:hypothetical protein BT96DRAFT_234501 [Gymnopus androsaceus JB14]
MSVEEADITEQKVLHEPGADDEDLVPEASEEQPESRFEEAFRAVPRPPLPAAGTRPVPADVQPMFVPPPPPPPPPVVPEYEPEHEDGAELAPPPPPRRTIPPPSQLIEDEDEQEETLAPPSVEPPRRLPPRPVLEDDGEMSDAPLPHPSRRSIPPPPPPAEEPAEEDDDEPKPVSASAPVRFVPPPPPESMPEEEEAETEEAEPKLEESTEEILPTPPRRAPSLEQQEEPLFIPPPPPKSANIVASIAQRRASQQVENVKLPSPTTHPEQMLVSTPALSVSDHSDDDQKGSEILDEEEGDPIDPSFYSPPSRRASALSPQAPAVPEPEQAPVEDEEQARRRTIAERMAKLGGIKFGAAPIPAPRPPPPPKRQESEDGNQGEGGVEIDADDKLELTEEEEERARKERIAAKMASMGGMRIGMQPFGMLSGRAPPPPSRPPPPESSSSSAPQQAPRHAAPPPPPPQDIDSEHESLATSDEGVRVEAEESEMEEVNYEDVQDEEEEVLPPPVPAREGRRSSGQYMPSHGRPPVPTTTPSRKSSAQSPASQTDAPPVPTARKSSASQPLPPSTSDYVMVEGSDEGESDSAPPPPPPRAGRPAPPRAPPVPPTDTTQPSESISSQWEMPSIPSVDFGESAELSLSWTDDITSSTQPPSEHPSLPKTSSNQVLSPDDLIAVWGKVGVQICEVATNLHEKSKKTLIGDGSYRGFIEATLREVPNAAPIAGQDYGYLGVYAIRGVGAEEG